MGYNTEGGWAAPLKKRVLPQGGRTGSGPPPASNVLAQGAGPEHLPCERSHRGAAWWNKSGFEMPLSGKVSLQEKEEAQAAPLRQRTSSLLQFHFNNY